MRNRLHVPIRCAALIDAPEAAVRRALFSRQVWIRTAVALGGTAEFAAAGSRIVAGDLARFTARPGGRPWLLRVGEVNGRPTLDSVTSTGRSTVSVRFDTSSSGAGCLVTVEFTVSSRVAFLNACYRPILIRYGEMLLGMTTLVAREPVRVVAGAWIAEGKVLVTRRRDPTGRWELPGGKAEPGESDEEALMRELQEELAIRSKVFRRIGPVVAVAPGVEMVCYRVAATHDDPIQLTDHDAYRWVEAAGLSTVDFLDSDRELLDSLRIALQMPA
ncbi:(deoxy)nucleoside triphosphate pyrophosphohydrolase [Nakamurella panacisegetis]|uniref:(deoxy)nucleoside triphosphate pyrophosphohydrolase n=1 Tax=Nakamurella panacisegetis TaxID=1090615 RepID=UPI0018D348D5|nr:NUDIX domain-containing protein [Nakamurella panacisegetis]